VVAMLPANEFPFPNQFNPLEIEKRMKFIIRSYISSHKYSRSFEFKGSFVSEIEGQIKAFEMHEPGNTSSNLFSFNLFPM
jgi:hypothetical protein